MADGDNSISRGQTSGEPALVERISAATILYNADLSDADLGGAVLLDPSQLESTMGSAGTKPRPGLRAEGVILLIQFPPQDSMDEQRKYAILFAATILAARKLNEIGNKPCPARECAIADRNRECQAHPSTRLRSADFLRERFGESHE